MRLIAKCFEIKDPNIWSRCKDLLDGERTRSREREKDSPLSKVGKSPALQTHCSNIVHLAYLDQWVSKHSGAMQLLGSFF